MQLLIIITPLLYYTSGLDMNLIILAHANREFLQALYKDFFIFLSLIFSFPFVCLK